MPCSNILSDGILCEVRCKRGVESEAKKDV